MSWRRSRTRSCMSAFEREQKRARPRTNGYGLMDRPARTNGKRFVYQNCMTAESWFNCLDVTLPRRTLMYAEQSYNCESCCDSVHVLLLGWLASALGYLLNWLAPLFVVGLLTLWLCYLLTWLSFDLETCIQPLTYKGCFVNLKRLFLSWIFICFCKHRLP
jgi:hypothetical protein